MSDYDERHDCASELQALSEILDQARLPECAAGARDAAVAVMVGDITTDKGWDLVLRYENLMADHDECVG